MTAMAVQPPVAAGTWASRVLDGQAQARYLATADGLRDAAAKVSAAAAELGCSNVMAASMHATGVVAAATVIDPTLCSCDLSMVRSGQVDRVVLVEAVAVSGLRVRQATAAAHQAGASWVGATVLFSSVPPGADRPTSLGLANLDAVVVP